MAMSRTKVVACATVIEEMLPMLPDGMTYEILDFGLHLTPEKLRHKLQETIDAASAEDDFVIARPGDTSSYTDFKTTATTMYNLPVCHLPLRRPTNV